MRLALVLLMAGCTHQGFQAEAIEVNTLVNRSHTYIDRPKGHVPRVMKPGEGGNCADFAVTKCATLADRGVPSDRLSLVKFIRWDGVHHGVCVLDGKWALDWKNHLVPATRQGLGSMTPVMAWKVD